MSCPAHTAVIYMAFRLITGKRVSFLSDLATGASVEIADVPDSGFISAFEEGHRDYLPGYASDCRHEFRADSGQSVEIFINERTFIAHVRGTDAYFIGNIQRDIIYVFDQKANVHFKYRTTCFPDEEKKARVLLDAAPEDPAWSGPA